MPPERLVITREIQEDRFLPADGYQKNEYWAKSHEYSNCPADVRHKYCLLGGRPRGSSFPVDNHQKDCQLFGKPSVQLSTRKTGKPREQLFPTRKTGSRAESQEDSSFLVDGHQKKLVTGRKAKRTALSQHMAIRKPGYLAESPEDRSDGHQKYC